MQKFELNFEELLVVINYNVDLVSKQFDYIESINREQAPQAFNKMLNEVEALLHRIDLLRACIRDCK